MMAVLNSTTLNGVTTIVDTVILARARLEISIVDQAVSSIRLIVVSNEEVAGEANTLFVISNTASLVLDGKCEETTVAVCKAIPVTDDLTISYRADNLVVLSSNTIECVIVPLIFAVTDVIKISTALSIDSQSKVITKLVITQSVCFHPEINPEVIPLCVAQPKTAKAVDVHAMCEPTVVVFNQIACELGSEICADTALIKPFKSTAHVTLLSIQEYLLLIVSSIKPDIAVESSVSESSTYYFGNAPDQRTILITQENKAEKLV